MLRTRGTYCVEYDGYVDTQYLASHDDGIRETGTKIPTIAIALT